MLFGLAVACCGLSHSVSESNFRSSEQPQVLPRFMRIIMGEGEATRGAW